MSGVPETVSSPVNGFLELPGAVAAEGLGVARHYGSPLVEQRALDAGDAVVDLSHRGIVTVTGEDRLSWLHSFTSQDLLRLAPGESVETLLLDANGRIEQVIGLVDDGTTSWLLVDEGRAEQLVHFLNRMRFAMRVEVTDVSDEFAAVLAFAGGSAISQLEKLLASSEHSDQGQTPVIWRDPWARVATGGAQYARGDHPATEWSATEFVVPRSRIPEIVSLVQAGQIQVAGLDALDALQIRAWRPTAHGEVDERAIAHEFDWLRSAVHLTKGCYRGQETVAKVHNLGRPPRRLVLLQLEGSGGELPQPRALIFPADAAPDARPVGRVTRVGLHHEWGGIALALVKRSVPEDAELDVRLGAPDADAEQAEVIRAAQEIIVPADAGATKDLPRLSRLGSGRANGPAKLAP